MIDLELWRARIGLFQCRLVARALRKSAKSRSRAKAAPDSQSFRSAATVATVVNLLMILLTATTIASKLLMAGDVEPNPGPETDGPLHVNVGRKSVEVFILYCMDDNNPFRYEDVLQLADLLNKCGGFQCTFDGYDRSNPLPSNWSQWTEKKIRDSNFVLMVCSAALLDALQRPTHNFVHMKRGKFYADAIVNAVSAPKFIPVFLNTSACLDWVPMSLQAASSYELRVQKLCNEMGSTDGMELKVLTKQLEEQFCNVEYQGIADLVALLRNQPLVATPPQTPEIVQTPVSSGQSLKPFLNRADPDPLVKYSEELKTQYDRWELSDVLTKFPQLGRGKYEYINLALIGKNQDEEVTSHRKDLTRTTIHGSIDDIARKKNPIEFEDVASSEEGRLILIEGAPGIGKTSFAWKLCKKWANGEVCSQYKLVLFLKLRDKKVRNAIRVEDLFYFADEITIQKIMRTHGEHVLFFLDGYDELSTKMRTEESIFLDLISGDELRYAKVIVTSRPTASEFLLTRYKNRISQHIEILGFTSENVEKYLQTTLAKDPNLLSGLREYLKCYPHIQNMLYIPLNCAIIINVYRQYMKANTKQVHVPKTMTDLYSSLLRTLLLRYLDNHPIHSTKTFTLRSFRDLPPDLYEHFYKLAEIAFMGIAAERQVIFELPSGFETLGLMHCVPEILIDKGTETSYSFLHLTIQEYLAAFYLSLEPPEKLQESILNYKRESNFQMVLRFFAGLTKFKAFKSKSVLQQYFKYDDSANETRVSLDSLHWIFEAQDRDLAINALGRSVRFIDLPPFSIFDCFVLGYCVGHSECLWDIKLSTEHLLDEGVKLFVQGALEDTTDCSGGISDLELHLKITSEGLRYLMQLSDKYLRTIKHLDLRNNHLDSQACSILCQSIPEMPRLEVIRLDSNPVGHGNGELVSLLELLSRKALSYTRLHHLESTLTSAPPLNCLKVLDLGNTALSLEHCKALSEMMGSTRTLKDLFVVDNKLSSECLEHIINGLSLNNTLFCLEMRGSCFSDENAKRLAAVLEQNHILIHVGLSFCNISPEGACFLADAMCKNDSLLKLYLDRNPIGFKGADAFAKMLHSNKSLKKLDVCDNSIGKDGAIALASALNLACNSAVFNLWLPDMFESVLENFPTDRIKFLYLQRKKWMNEKWGERETGDQLLYREKIRQEYRYQPDVFYTSHTFAYTGTSSTVITCVEANDCWDDGTGGEPTLRGGDCGESFVTVEIMGQFMSDFEHTVTVYGKKLQHQESDEDSEDITERDETINDVHQQPCEFEEAPSVEPKHREESYVDSAQRPTSLDTCPFTLERQPKQFKLESTSTIEQVEQATDSHKAVMNGNRGNHVTNGDCCASQTQSEVDDLSEDDFLVITDYLEPLRDDSKAIYNLGLALKLKQKEVKELREQQSDTFLDDVITKWLEEAQHPTWKTLVNALRHRRVGKDGLAEQIAKEKGLAHVE